MPDSIFPALHTFKIAQCHRRRHFFRAHCCDGIHIAVFNLFHNHYVLVNNSFLFCFSLPFPVILLKRGTAFWSIPSHFVASFFRRMACTRFVRENTTRMAWRFSRATAGGRHDLGDASDGGYTFATRMGRNALRRNVGEQGDVGNTEGTSPYLFVCTGRKTRRAPVKGARRIVW